MANTVILEPLPADIDASKKSEHREVSKVIHEGLKKISESFLHDWT